MSYLKISNRIIEWGIIFLIIFTPIAFGAVHRWAYTLMELTICFLAIIWIIRLAIINTKKSSIVPSKSQIRNRKSTIVNPKSEILGPHHRADRTRAGRNPQPSLVNRLGFIKTPLNIPIILFVGLILFQLAPLPPGVLKFLSPNTYELYKTTSPGWPTDKIQDFKSEIRNPWPKPQGGSHQGRPKSEIVNPNSSLANPDPSNLKRSAPQTTNSSYRSLSIYKHATGTELYKILAYIGIFLLIVNYNPSNRSRRPVSDRHRSQIKTFITRLIITMIVIGSFESFYGLLESLSGHQHIFFRQKVDHLGFVTGTYLNRNHFAGYLAIVICMGFGYLISTLSGSSNSNVTLRVRDSTESATGWRQKLSQIINSIGTGTGLLFFILLIMSSALILSGSRMGICSFIAAIIIVGFVISKKSSIKKTFLILIPVFLIAVWIGLNPVIKRFSQVSSELESESGRIQVWKDTSVLIKDFPAMGTGLGTYEYAFPKYKTFKAQTIYDHAHNDYLELISDTGFTGFIIVIAGGAYYLFMVTRLWFKRRSPFVRCITSGCLGGIAYIMLHSFTDFNLQVPANALHLSIITGIMHKTLTQL